MLAYALHEQCDGFCITGVSNWGLAGKKARREGGSCGYGGAFGVEGEEIRVSSLGCCNTKYTDPDL